MTNPLPMNSSSPQASEADMLHFVFDGPPGPTAGRFVEVETPEGHSINAGEWHERPDGFWELRVKMQSARTPSETAWDQPDSRVSEEAVPSGKDMNEILKHLRWIVASAPDLEQAKGAARNAIDLHRISGEGVE